MQGALSALRSAICAIAAALLASCGSKAEEPAKTIAAPPPLVEVVSIVSSDSAGTVRASGLLAYKRETALGFGSAAIRERPKPISPKERKKCVFIGAGIL